MAGPRSRARGRRQFNQLTLTNIPRLTSRDNYSEWTFAVENFVVLASAEKYIRELLRSEDDDQSAAQVEDAKTKAKIIDH